MNEIKISRSSKVAKSLDTIDKRILRIVQQDAARPLSDIAAHVGLSQTPCWNRLKRLAALGVIKRRVAILDQQKLGLATTVIILIQIGDHSRTELARFAREVAAMDEVIDFYRLAGDVDYCLRVVVSNAAAHDDFHKRLIGLIPLKSVVSRFALENIKSTTALPIKD
jgi:Lrp/AsnC family transcriptional regulator